MNEEIIIETACDYFKINKDQLNLKKRKRHLVYARQVCIYFFTEKLKYTDKMSAKTFGLDRSTALYARNTISNLLETDSKVIEDLWKIDLILEDLNISNRLIPSDINLLKLSINYTNSLI